LICANSEGALQVGRGVTNLDVDIALVVVEEAFELEVQDGWQRLEDVASLGVLETVTLDRDLVVAIHNLLLDVELEGFLEIFEVVHVELDVCAPVSYTCQTEAVRIP
jgi:hypothetical protein